MRCHSTIWTKPDILKSNREGRNYVKFYEPQIFLDGNGTVQHDFVAQIL